MKLRVFRGHLQLVDLYSNYRKLVERVNGANVEHSKLLRKPLNGQSRQEDGHQDGRRAQTAPVRCCESLLKLALPDASINSAAAAGQVCRVDATVTHPPAGDRVKIRVALPITEWNGAFREPAAADFRAAILNRPLNPLAKAMPPLRPIPGTKAVPEVSRSMPTGV